MSNQRATWESFYQKPNTETVLVEKARITCKLIQISLDTGIFAARSVKDQVEGVENKPFGALTEREVMAETAAVLLRVVQELATGSLQIKGRDMFMTALEQFVAEALERQGLKRNDFFELLRPRYAEYAHYVEWIPMLGKGAKRTLFWEYGNKVALRTGLGMNGLLQIMLSNMLMKNIHGWNLVSLLKGQ